MNWLTFPVKRSLLVLVIAQLWNDLNLVTMSLSRYHPFDQENQEGKANADT